jgi:hypothetical protein
MGLLGDLFGGRRMRDPVRGTAQVVSCTGHRGEGVMQSCRMQLVVQADGVPAKALEHSELVHYTRWPSPGITLPVTVDRSNPARLKVEWDEVASTRDRAEAAAEDLAGEKRDEPVVPTGGGITPQMIDGPGALAARGDGAPPRQADGGVEHRIERLERLAKLHEQGILTDAELAEQTRQVLGD